MRKKKSFILIEALIATSIFALLFITIFSIWQNWQEFDQVLYKKKHRQEKSLVLGTRLQNIFLNALTPKEKGKPPIFFFSQEGLANNLNSQSLIFYYDHGADRGKVLSGKLLGKLYVDENQALQLILWPAPYKRDGIPEVYRQETLLEGVISIEFKFFRTADEKAKDTKDTKDKDSDEAPRLIWTSSWQKDYQLLPTLMSMKVTFSEKKSNLDNLSKTFWFIFPEEIGLICYKSK